MERREQNSKRKEPDSIGGRRIVTEGGASIPRVEERVEIGKRRVQRGTLRLEKRVFEDEIAVDEPLMQEDIEIEHVSVNRFVDRPPRTRIEGGVLIVPCLEEVIVYEKRLRLREELHVRTVRRRTREPVTVVARREEIVAHRQSKPGEHSEEEEKS